MTKILSVIAFLTLNILIVNCLKLVCYWPKWGPTRDGDAKNNPEDINANLCTHIHYAFGSLDQNSLTIKFANPAVDSDYVRRINNLKKINPNLKVILALGGWGDSGSNKYSRMVSNAMMRANFVLHSVKFLKDNHFDGLDLDWEFPVCWQSDCSKGPASDKQNFAKLIEELRKAFDQQTPHLSLSAAVNSGQWLVDKAYDLTVFGKSLDYINIMTYDNAGLWEGKTGHHSGFEWARSRLEWWSQRIPNKSKLLMGVPFYGISFTLQDPNKRGIGAPVTASSTLSYLDICNDIKRKGWTKEYIHPHGPIAYHGNQWVGYDDANRIFQKGEWVRDNGYGGLLIWEISQDDVRGKCCTTDRPLLKAANYGLFKKGSPPNTYGCE